MCLHFSNNTTKSSRACPVFLWLPNGNVFICVSEGCWALSCSWKTPTLLQWGCDLCKAFRIYSACVNVFCSGLCTEVILRGLVNAALCSQHKWLWCFLFFLNVYYVHCVKVHVCSDVCFWSIKNVYVCSCNIVGGKGMLLAHLLLLFSKAHVWYDVFLQKSSYFLIFLGCVLFYWIIPFWAH